MVKFSPDGQGYFDFLVENCSEEFINEVNSSLNKTYFEENKIINLIKKSNMVSLYVSHDDSWFSILSEITHPDGEKNVFNQFLNFDELKFIFDYMEDKKWHLNQFILDQHL